MKSRKKSQKNGPVVGGVRKVAQEHLLQQYFEQQKQYEAREAAKQMFKDKPKSKLVIPTDKEVVIVNSERND